MSNELAKTGGMPASIYSDMGAFENAQRVAQMLTKSDLVPAIYRNNLPNTMIAMEMANRMQTSPFMIMQSLDIIQGRPSFRASFLIATLNTCGRFTDLTYEVKDLGKKKVKYSVWVGDKPNRKKENREIEIHDFSFIAVAKSKATGETLKGPKVTVEMAVLEGWYTKNDSKWPTMCDLMGRYRAAAFFTRSYAPELSLGMRTTEEYMDAEFETIETTPHDRPTAAAAAEKLNADQPLENVVRIEPKTPPPGKADADAEQEHEAEEIIPENETDTTDAGDGADDELI